jgi:hypothetical protein
MRDRIDASAMELRKPFACLLLLSVALMISSCNKEYNLYNLPFPEYDDYVQGEEMYYPNDGSNDDKTHYQMKNVCFGFAKVTSDHYDESKYTNHFSHVKNNEEYACYLRFETIDSSNCSILLEYDSYYKPSRIFEIIYVFNFKVFIDEINVFSGKGFNIVFVPQQVIVDGIQYARFSCSMFGHNVEYLNEQPTKNNLISGVVFD